MKNWLKIVVILFLIIFYIISINVFANLISFSKEQSKISETIIGGNIVKIGVGQSVSVQVTRPRVYGTIYENNGLSYLHLFDLIVLPHKIKKYNFMIFHIIFLISLILFTILIFTKQKIYKEENLNLEHEKLA